MTIQKFFPFTMALEPCKNSGSVPKFPVKKRERFVRSNSLNIECLSSYNKQKNTHDCQIILRRELIFQVLRL